MSVEAERLQAAEEVLANLAQTKPEMGFVKRAIAAIRTWLRAHVPGFSNLKVTDAEIVNQFIIPARRFVDSGKTGSAAKGATAFSRAELSALAELSKADDLFSLPKSEKTDIQGIISDNSQAVTVNTTRTALGVTHKLTMPDGTIATLTERKPSPYGKSLYGYDLVRRNGE